MTTLTWGTTGFVARRIVAQAENSSPGGGYVLAAYLIAAILLFGYGLSIYVRMRGARDDLAAYSDGEPEDAD